jgi:hypothetical protein
VLYAVLEEEQRAIVEEEQRAIVEVQQYPHTVALLVVPARSSPSSPLLLLLLLLLPRTFTSATVSCGATRSSTPAARLCHCRCRHCPLRYCCCEYCCSRCYSCRRTYKPATYLLRPASAARTVRSTACLCFCIPAPVIVRVEAGVPRLLWGARPLCRLGCPACPLPRPRFRGFRSAWCSHHSHSRHGQSAGQGVHGI